MSENNELCMENQDTKDLLKQCDAGCKMATNSIEQVYDHVEDKDFKEVLRAYNEDHVRLGEECHRLLDKYHLKEEDPPMMASTMATISTEMKMMMNSDVKEIAKIMMDGCNMGIQSLSKYLNQYKEANQECRKLCQKLIESEFDFMHKVAVYL